MSPVPVARRLLAASWLAAAALASVAAATAVAAPTGAAEPSAEPVVELSRDWEYRWGDSPAGPDGVPALARDDSLDSAASGGWRALDDLRRPPGRDGRTTVWLRTRLPAAAAGPHAVLHVTGVMLACEVYLDGTRLLQVGSLRPDPSNRFLPLTRHTIPLPPGSAGKLLVIRLYSDTRSFHGIEGPLLVGPAEPVIRTVALEGLGRAAVGVMFVLIGASSLLLYVSRRGWTHVEYLSFGGFATAVGVQPIATSPLFEWLTGAPAVAYFLLFPGFVLFPVGLLAFLAQTLGEGPFRVMRRLWQAHLVLAGAGLVLDVTGVLALPVLAQYVLPLLAVDVVVSLVVCNGAARRGTAEARVVNAGAALLALAGLHDVVTAAFSPGSPPLFLWSAFVFAVLLAYLLERRFAESHRRLEQQAEALARGNDELRREVGVRTAAEEALRKAHADLEQLKDRLQAETVYLQEEIKVEHDFGNILSRSECMRAVLRQVEQVAPAESTVLILGETGTGKELVARAVHDLSRRRDRALVKVNCAALPAHLIESELFGHERGAFTGAVARQLGRFELAHGGTLFLDEVGDLPLELQAKLLRVLQEGELERLGSAKTIAVDVRVIAATNRDLGRAVAQGTFRSDLYYRLNVFPIALPPLRDRREDIPLLVQHFVHGFSLRCGKTITAVAPAVMSALQAYAWPGNVRELENVIERAVIISPGPRIEPGEWLPKPSPWAEATAGAGAADVATSASDAGLLTLAAVEEGHIRRVLQATGWRVSGAAGAASILGLKRTTLEARMRRLGIVRPPRS